MGRKATVTAYAQSLTPFTGDEWVVRDRALQKRIPSWLRQRIAGKDRVVQVSEALTFVKQSLKTGQRLKHALVVASATQRSIHTHISELPDQWRRAALAYQAAVKDGDSVRISATEKKFFALHNEVRDRGYAYEAFLVRTKGWKASAAIRRWFAQARAVTSPQDVERNEVPVLSSKASRRPKGALAKALRTHEAYSPAIVRMLHTAKTAAAALEHASPRTFQQHASRDALIDLMEVARQAYWKVQPDVAKQELLKTAPEHAQDELAAFLAAWDRLADSFSPVYPVFNTLACSPAADEHTVQTKMAEYTPDLQATLSALEACQRTYAAFHAALLTAD